MAQVIIEIKQIIKHLSCLGILDPDVSLIVETNASHIRYRGILKQVSKNSSKKQIDIIRAFDIQLNKSISRLKRNLIHCFMHYQISR